MKGFEIFDGYILTKEITLKAKRKYFMQRRARSLLGHPFPSPAIFVEKLP